jgi:arylsulfate sulfotransferase
MGRTINQESDREFGLFVALDAQGEVVWFYEAPHRVDEPRRLPNGNILYRGVRTQMFEIDMLGRRVNHWAATAARKDAPPTATAVDTDSLHHDVLRMPSGNFLALSTEVRHFENYPTSVEDQGAGQAPANVIGDVLIEFRPDGEIVREWKFFDLLDPRRLGYGSLNTGFYEEVYKDVLEEPGYDWTHANGIDYDAGSDSALISINHLSAVVKLDLGSGEIAWILGHPEGWQEKWQALRLRPKGDLDWFWHQHAPEITPDGTLLIYDNGAFRAFPPDPKILPPDTFSRAVEYRIDEANRTVEEVWSYGGPGDEWFFSGFISEADWMPETGNILVTSGGRVHKPDGTPGVFGSDGRLWITIAEVTHTDPAEKVWEVVIDDPTTGWSAFRSERVPSLYP